MLPDPRDGSSCTAVHEGEGLADILEGHPMLGQVIQRKQFRIRVDGQVPNAVTFVFPPGDDQSRRAEGRVELLVVSRRTHTFIDAPAVLERPYR